VTAIAAKCDYAGDGECLAAAPFVPVLCIPATGHAIDTHRPLEFTLSIHVCEAHKREVKPEHFLSPEIEAKTGKPGLRRFAEIMVRGRAAPDFGRAFVTFVTDDHPSVRFLLDRKTQ